MHARRSCSATCWPRPHGDACTARCAQIAAAGRGVVVLIRENAPTALSERVRRPRRRASAPNRQLRDYGIGAQILLDLGVKDMILLSNTQRTIVGLEGYGLNMVDQRADRRDEAG